MKPALVFVYNADGGLFNALTDLAHKILSPQTYACNLCALTYSHTGMRDEWKQFLEDLDRPVEFLHRDEIKKIPDLDLVELPAIFRRQDEHLSLWIGADAINACKTLDDLKRLITQKLDS